MSHDHAATDVADALDALQVKFDAQDVELMRLTALVDSLVQKIGDLTATIKALASAPALTVPPAAFARDLQALRDDAVRRATAEVERTAQAERKAVSTRQQADVRRQVDAGLRQHRKFWVGLSFVAGLIAAGVGATSLRGGVKLAIWATGEQNGWDAGSRLMESADPATWNKLADLSVKLQEQEAAVRACQNADVFGTKAAACVPKPVK